LPALTGNQGVANVAGASSRTFEDMKVGVRCKIAALWIAMLFLFAYGDIFGFFSQGQLEELAYCQLSGMRITQASCSRLAVCRGRERDGVPLAGPQPDRQPLDQHRVGMAIRGLHRGVGDRETSAYYWFLSITESALLLGIV
jgi:hypothetical protein